MSHVDKKKNIGMIKFSRMKRMKRIKYLRQCIQNENWNFLQGGKPHNKLSEEVRIDSHITTLTCSNCRLPLTLFPRNTDD